MKKAGNIGSVIDDKINEMKMCKGGHKLQGLDIFVEPMKTELMGAQTFVLLERQSQLKQLIQKEYIQYEEEMKAKGLAIYKDD